MHLWHNWSKWSKGTVIEWGNQRNEVMKALTQARQCTVCGKEEYRRIGSGLQ